MFGSLAPNTKVPLPAATIIHSDKDDKRELIAEDEKYFFVHLREMMLFQNKKWWSLYDPFVEVFVELNQGYDRITVPGFVGPSSIHASKKYVDDDSAPVHGTVLSDVVIAGPFPYVGGSVDISVRFYAVQRTDAANAVLKLIGNLAHAVGAMPMAGAEIVSTDVALIGKVGSVLVGALGELRSFGGTQFLAGFRTSLAPTPFDKLKSCYIPLIVPQAHDVETVVSRLLVRDRRLFLGNLDGSAVPYKNSDFALISIDAAERRGDVRRLPFYRRVRDAISAIWSPYLGSEKAKLLLMNALAELQATDAITKLERQLLTKQYLLEFEKEIERFECAENASATPSEAPHPPTGTEAEFVSSMLDDISRKLGIAVG